MPFALDDLGVIFCKESIGLKKNFSRPQIFFPGVVSDPLFLTPWKKHLLPSFYILFSTIYSAFWDVYIAPSMHFLHRKGYTSFLGCIHPDIMDVLHWRTNQKFHQKFSVFECMKIAQNYAQVSLPLSNTIQYSKMLIFCWKALFH